MEQKSHRFGSWLVLSSRPSDPMKYAELMSHNAREIGFFEISLRMIDLGPLDGYGESENWAIQWVSPPDESLEGTFWRGKSGTATTS